jgi:exodeoxyribonuclease V beta subunit
MGSTHPGIVVAGHPDEPDHNRLAQLTTDGLDELDRRLAARSLMTYQQLLNRVAAAVNGPKNSGRRRHPQTSLQGGLIDEFQDTDPVQWEVFRLLFAGSDGADSPTLVLVGDPKQAIYSFRGADIATYLNAKAVVTTPAPSGPQLAQHPSADRSAQLAVRGQPLRVVARRHSHDRLRPQ